MSSKSVASAAMVLGTIAAMILLAFLIPAGHGGGENGTASAALFLTNYQFTLIAFLVALALLVYLVAKVLPHIMSARPSNEAPLSDSAGDPRVVGGVHGRREGVPEVTDPLTKSTTAVEAPDYPMIATWPMVRRRWSGYVLLETLGFIAAGLALAIAKPVWVIAFWSAPAIVFWVVIAFLLVNWAIIALVIYPRDIPLPVARPARHVAFGKGTTTAKGEEKKSEKTSDSGIRWAVLIFFLIALGLVAWLSGFDTTQAWNRIQGAYWKAHAFLSGENSASSPATAPSYAPSAPAYRAPTYAPPYSSDPHANAFPGFTLAERLTLSPGRREWTSFRDATKHPGDAMLVVTFDTAAQEVLERDCSGHIRDTNVEAVRTRLQAWRTSDRALYDANYNCGNIKAFNRGYVLHTVYIFVQSR